MTTRASSDHQFRGELIDIGGRRLRVVWSGMANSGPLIVFECGAFGCAADWAAVQDRLAASKSRSLAYDRAGLGYSDVGQEPRDGVTLVSDLEALLASLGETGPIILVGHSMAGLLAPIFVARNRTRVTGLVLVDAMAPEAVEVPSAARMINSYRRAMGLVGRWSEIGFMGPVAAVAGNLIGLEGEAAREKRRIYGMARHARGAAREVDQWFVTSAQASALGSMDPDLPVAVITAAASRLPARLKALQHAPGHASRQGYVLDVKGANHASLLGTRFADAIVEGIRHVLRQT